MKAAQIANIAFLALIVPVAALVVPLDAWAASGSIQVCRPSTSCIVGEFLYDDSYAPITEGATCTISARYPNGTSFLSSEAMSVSAQGDGWYSYTFTAPSTTGIYRTEVRCTVDSQVLAIDKSFEVQETPSTLTASDVTGAVWNASRSSYTTSGSFGEALQNVVPVAGDVATSVWGYSGRTITSFGTLVSDIWSSATRTLTGASLTSGSLATKANVDAIDTNGTDIDNINSDVTTVKNNVSDIKSDITKIKDSVSKIENTTSSTTSTTNITNIQDITSETRDLLDKLINKPVIENVLDSEATIIELEEKIGKSNTLANQLLAESNYLKSKVNLIRAKWDDLDSEQIRGSIENLSSLVGQETDETNAATIFGQMNWIKKQWTFPIMDKLYAQGKSLTLQLSSVNKGLANRGKAKSVLISLQQLSASADNLIKLVGSDSGTSKNTLFGQIKGKKELSYQMDKSYISVNKFLKDWNYDPKNAEEKADKQIVGQMAVLIKEVLTFNLIPKVNNFFSLQTNMTQKELRNKAFDLRGIIDANKQFLAVNSASPFSSLWLGEGSIVFKTLITNPSSRLTQQVELKYYLPKEVTKESIIKTDEGLTISYDTEKDQYFVSGEFMLKAKETKTVSMTVDDSVFQISSGEVVSLRKQTDELSKPLKNTAYFAQGATLKSDIDVSLDKVEVLQKEGITPEAKIKAFRDAQIELKSAKEKVEKLKELTTAAGSVGTLFGFVGGAQVIAVWGLIIVMVAGFVFLALYMKLLRKGEPVESTIKKPLSVINEEGAEYYDPEKASIEPAKLQRYRGKSIAFIGVFIIGGLISLSIVYAVFNVRQNMTSVNLKKEKLAQNTEPVKTVLGENISPEEDLPTNKEINIFVPNDSIIDIFTESSLKTPILATLSASQKAKEIKRDKAWVKVSLEDQNGKSIKGWIDQDFIEEQSEEASLKATSNRLSYLSVIDTPTGFLRVRSAPGGQELAKVNPGETYPTIQQEAGWMQIVLEDGTLGWVSKKYTKENE